MERHRQSMDDRQQITIRRIKNGFTVRDASGVVAFTDVIQTVSHVEKILKN